MMRGLMRILARRTRGGAILHVLAPPRRSRPWSQGPGEPRGVLAGGASADCHTHDPVVATVVLYVLKPNR